MSDEQLTGTCTGCGAIVYPNERHICQCRDEQQGDRCVCGRLKSEHTPTKGCVELAMSDEQQGEDHYEYIDGRAVAAEQREVEQILGAALGYPRYCDDPVNFPAATADDGVCVGEHVPATLAVEIAERLSAARQDLAAAEARFTCRGGFIEEADGTRWWSANLLKRTEEERDEALQALAAERERAEAAEAGWAESNNANIDLTRALREAKVEMDAERDEARREIERLREEMRDCDACAGTGTPASGPPCMCGGTGRARDAVSYLRPELHRERAAKVALADAARALLNVRWGTSRGEAALGGYEAENLRAALRAATGE